MDDDVVPRGTPELEAFAAMLRDEAGRQNLVAASTLATLWERHIADSAQLISLAPADGCWIDIGSGAGLPGMVVALLTARPCVLIEPRKRRAAFLQEVVATLGLSPRVEIKPARAEMVRAPAAAVISARAVAGLADLFAMATHLADLRTTWILPKGRSAAAELAAAREIWHGDFRLAPSRTDPDAGIVVATGVCRRRPA